MPYYEPLRRYPGVPRYGALEAPRPTGDGGAAATARQARHLAMLGALADMAMDLAQSAYVRAKARDAALEPGEGEDCAAAPPAATAGDAEPPAGAGEQAEDRIEALTRALRGAISGGEGGGSVPSGADPSLVFARLSAVVFRAVAMEKEIAEAAEAAAAEDETSDPYYDPEMTPERKAKIEARWKLLCCRKHTIVKVLQAAIAAERPNEDADACALALNDKLLEFERFEVLNYPIWTNVERHAAKLGLHPKWEDWANEPWAIAEKDGELEWDHNPYRDRSP